jgi:hypothetical protein
MKIVKIKQQQQQQQQQQQHLIMSKVSHSVSSLKVKTSCKSSLFANKRQTVTTREANSLRLQMQRSRTALHLLSALACSFSSTTMLCSPCFDSCR